MTRGFLRFLRGNTLALLALFVALGGTTYAATALPNNSVGTKQLKKNAVTNPKIKNAAVTGAKVADNSIKGADVLESSLGKVPSATNADNATHATNADNATHATTANSAAPSGVAGGALAGSYPNPSLAAPENYHEVGAPGEPAFQNSWVNEAPGSESTGAFFKDPFGVVHLKGILSGGAASTTILTLPAGYRPTKSVCFDTNRNSAVAYVCVFATGAVQQLGGGSTGFLLLDGLTFREGAG
jgi:hypothetical protein